MMADPLNPGPVRPMDTPYQLDSFALTGAARPSLPAGEMKAPEPVDARPFWRRLLTSLRPTAAVEIDKKTGKPIETVGFKAGTDF